MGKMLRGVIGGHRVCGKCLLASGFAIGFQGDCFQVRRPFPSLLALAGPGSYGLRPSTSQSHRKRLTPTESLSSFERFSESEERPLGGHAWTMQPKRNEKVPSPYSDGKGAPGFSDATDVKRPNRALRIAKAIGPFEGRSTALYPQDGGFLPPDGPRRSPGPGSYIRERHRFGSVWSKKKREQNFATGGNRFDWQAPVHATTPGPGTYFIDN